jgi:thioredoxin-related protein
MKTVLSSLFVLISFVSLSQEVNKTSEIKWMSMQEAFEASDNQNNTKKIFIDIYTDWCKWCDEMDKTTFTDTLLTAYMNKHYYAVKFDAESDDTITYRGVSFGNAAPGVKKKGERGSYHLFASGLLDGQLSYPSYVVLDEHHTRLSIYKGYLQINELMSVLVFFALNQHQQFTQYLYGEFEKIQKKKNQEQTTK